MAVVPMQKIKLLIHRSDVNAVLDVMQRFGALELVEVEAAGANVHTMPFAYANILPRIEHALAFVTPYAPKVGLLKSLREGSFTELTESAIERILQDTDAVEAVVADIETLQVEFAEKTDAIRVLEEQRAFLREWKTLPFPLSKLATTATVTKLITAHQLPTGVSDVSSALEAQLVEAQLPYMLTTVDTHHVAVTITHDCNAAVFAQCVDAVGAEIVTPLPLTNTPDVELVAVEEQLAKLKGEIGLLHDQTEHAAKLHLKSLRITAEVLGWARERHEALIHAESTERVLMFTGWLNANKRSAIEAVIADKKLAASLVECEIAEGEEPPVDIENKGWIQPFEAVTRLYGMPGYKDLDPTVFLAGFFFLFFGLSLTDVGYGLALVVAASFILFFCKIDKGTRSFATLLLYIGLATVFVGALFGGYLGIDPSLLPEPLQKIQMFDPIGNPLPVFYLALALGVLQVMVGLMIKIYSDARNGHLLDGIFDQGPWLLMFFTGIAYVAQTTGYLNVSADLLGNIALVAAGLIVLSAGRHPGSIIQKVISSAAGLYAGVGYFSDILSYSRLLALGLATSALAFAVNLIAGMVSGVPYVGFLLSAVILIIGHVFTLLINTLGAFVHSARLQFVEFFGKFIAGTGREFSPLTRRKQYVAIDDD